MPWCDHTCRFDTTCPEGCYPRCTCEHHQIRLPLAEECPFCRFPGPWGIVQADAKSKAARALRDKTTEGQAATAKVAAHHAAAAAATVAAYTAAVAAAAAAQPAAAAAVVAAAEPVVVIAAAAPPVAVAAVAAAAEPVVVAAAAAPPVAAANAQPAAAATVAATAEPCTFVAAAAQTAAAVAIATAATVAVSAGFNPVQWQQIAAAAIAAAAEPSSAVTVAAAAQPVVDAAVAAAAAAQPVAAAVDAAAVEPFAATAGFDPVWWQQMRQNAADFPDEAAYWQDREQRQEDAAALAGFFVLYDDKVKYPVGGEPPAHPADALDQHAHNQDANETDCHYCGNLGELLCCDGCPRVFHFECITPPLRKADMPKGDWYCPLCDNEVVTLLPEDDERAAAHTATQLDDAAPQETVEVKAEEDVEVEDPYEPKCHSCGEEDDLISCSSCPLWFHGRCLTPPMSAAVSMAITTSPGHWYCPCCVSDGTAAYDAAVYHLRRHGNVEATADSESDEAALSAGIAASVAACDDAAAPAASAAMTVNPSGPPSALEAGSSAQHTMESASRPSTSNVGSPARRATEPTSMALPQTPPPPHPSRQPWSFPGKRRSPRNVLIAFQTKSS